MGPFTEICALLRSEFSSVEGGLSVGARTVIGANCNLRAAGGKISIGSNCLIAQHVTIASSNHQFRQGAVYRDLPWDEARVGVTIRDNCWLGAGVIVLPGVVIGANSIVAAGAVVTSSIPPDEVWGGVPARRLRGVPAADAVKRQGPDTM